MTGNELKNKITLKTLATGPGGALTFGRGTGIWAGSERLKGKVAYAPHGMASTQGVQFTIRERDVDLSRQLIEWRGESYIPAETWTEARGWTAIKAARVHIRQWTYTGPRKDPEHSSFPGILSELWQGRQDPDYHSEIHAGLLLVTPKAVELRPGDALTCEGKRYRVDVCHKLEDHINEYEVYSREDV